MTANAASSVPQSDFLAVLNAGWFSVALTVVVFVLATVLTIVLYGRAKPIPRLRYVMADVSLIGGAVDTMLGDLEVRFAGRPVPRVTSTTLGLWNDGTFTFRGSDAVASDMLRLECGKNAEVLRATVEAATREVLDIKIKSISQSALIDFDFLDPGDGFRVRVIHSGEPGALKLQGTIRGLPNGVSPQPPAGGGLQLSMRIISVLLSIMLGALFVAIAREFIHASWSGKLQGILWLGGAAVIGAFIRWFDSKPRSRRVKGIPQPITEDAVIYARLRTPLADETFVPREM